MSPGHRMPHMQAQTRQTSIGVVCLTAVEIVALLEGFNGRVVTVYVLAVILLITPEALDRLEISLV
jgi:hypothetical protein